MDNSLNVFLPQENTDLLIVSPPSQLDYRPYQGFSGHNLGAQVYMGLKFYLNFSVCSGTVSVKVFLFLFQMTELGVVVFCFVLLWPSKRKISLETGNKAKTKGKETIKGSC